MKSVRLKAQNMWMQDVSIYVELSNAIFVYSVDILSPNAGRRNITVINVDTNIIYQPANNVWTQHCLVTLEK